MIGRQFSHVAIKLLILPISDEISKPRADIDLDNGEIDEFEREIEEFKR